MNCVKHENYEVAADVRDMINGHTPTLDTLVQPYEISQKSYDLILDIIEEVRQQAHELLTDTRAEISLTPVEIGNYLKLLHKIERRAYHLKTS